MGRAERRRLERQERISDRKEKILLTKKDISALKKEMTEVYLNHNSEALLTCFALAGRRLHGYGQKRIMKELRYIDELMGPIIDGTATIDDYKKELEDEAGVVIRC